MSKEKPSYYAIIPASVRYDKNLKPNEKLMFGEITALCNKNGYCHASNKYFSELYDVQKETISRWIKKLSELNYIKVKLNYAEGTNQIVNRYIYLCQHPIDLKVNTPIDKKVKDNNTSNNTTSIIKNQKQKVSQPENKKLIDSVDEPIKDHFLRHFNQQRIKIQKCKSAFNRLSYHEQLKELYQHYTHKELIAALEGLFSQKGALKAIFTPEHFLRNYNYDKYLDARINKNRDLYQSQDKDTKKGML